MLLFLRLYLAFVEVFKVDYFKKYFKSDPSKPDQKQNSLNTEIANLQKQFDEVINNKDFSANKILLLLQGSKNFSDLQKAINKEVTEKLSPEKIINWESIKFLFLTDKNIIQILNIM